ncbi:hypothetical protein [Halosimplex sp. TS25]|uniref:hypothetical protein n=1 Tax=Halosimplex rarum TaxID=3396619 RepID=UPI0039EC1EC6
MASSVQTAEDIVSTAKQDENSLRIPLRIDSIDETEDHDYWAQIVHCSDVTGVHVKITVFEDCELAGYEFIEGSWYEFDDVRPDIYQGTIGIQAKWERQIQELENCPAPSSPSGDGVVKKLGDAESIAALDIETISTVSESDREATNPDHQEILCIGLGYRADCDSEVETEVLFREDQTETAELEAIEAVVDWIETRDIEVIVTFSGAWFDFPVLLGRAKRAAVATGEPERGDRIRTVLESHHHADLSAAKNRALGAGSLEDMASHVGSPVPTTCWTDYETGLSPRNWRGDQWQLMHENGRTPPSYDLDDTEIFNSDIPYFGAAWLEAPSDGSDTRATELYDCIEDYTKADIQPLFSIADHEITRGQPAFQMSYDVNGG